MVTRYILQGGVRWYANCGFSFEVPCPPDRNAPRNPPRQHVPTVRLSKKQDDTMKYSDMSL